MLALNPVGSYLGSAHIQFRQHSCPRAAVHLQMMRWLRKLLPEARLERGGFDGEVAGGWQ